MTIAELSMASSGSTELVPHGETSQNAMGIIGLSPVGSTVGEAGIWRDMGKPDAARCDWGIDTAPIL